MIKLKDIVKEIWELGKERYKVTLSDGSEIDIKLNKGTGEQGIHEVVEEEIEAGRLPKEIKVTKIESKASRPTLIKQ